MKMIIGGACQGKEAYAKERCPDVRWIYGDSCRLDEIYTCQGIVGFHEYIKRWMQTSNDRTAQEFAKTLFECNPNLIIVTNEIGYGLVPMDSFLREYREQTGRICTLLATYSDEVVRVVCGIPVVLKEKK